MENSFVVIGYDKNQKFISKIERGPFNSLTDFFYVKSQKKKLAEYLNKEELKILKPFDLEKEALEIEDVEGWEDPVFLKGKRSPISFLNAFYKFKSSLPLLLSKEDITFLEKQLHQFSADLEQLLNDPNTKYITFYDLLV